MTPTQGEHAQTEAQRPKFGDLLRNTMASDGNPRRDAYFIREVHRSGGGVNPGRWFEMTDGKGETWLSNPQNMVPAATQCEHAQTALEDFEVRKLAAIGAVSTSSGLVERRPIEYRRELENQFVRGYRAAESRLHAQVAALTAAPADADNLRKALQFYADGHHFTKSDGDAWDTVSGEPQNYWCDEAGTATVEDGSIAKLALAGQPIKFEDEDTTAQAAPDAGAVARKVFLVATGEEHEGEATYTRYDDAPPPLCDSECLYTAAPTPAAQADSVLKDHQIAALVNELRDIAVEFQGTQQLRERIAQVVVPALKAQKADSVLKDAARLEVERLRGLAATCYAGLGAECELPERWLDVLNAASNGEPFSTDGLLPFRSGASAMLDFLEAKVERWNTGDGGKEAKLMVRWHSSLEAMSLRDVLRRDIDAARKQGAKHD